MTQLNSYHQKELLPFKEHKQINEPSLYRPSEGLKNAVNVAVFLGKPLLLTGEPGSGKTQLAHHIAGHFGLGEPLVFNTRTTSTASDLFYTYDALKHYQYIQNHKEVLTADEIERRFINYQALGKAIKSGQRAVVLIDEIDKAPRDLPNDILNIIEDLEFKVPEVIDEEGNPRRYQASQAQRPIIILTSNSEKNLPDAFLRRCVFYHLQFPSPTELLRIVTSKVSGELYKADQVENYVIPHFINLRDKHLKRKKPSTSELLYWVVLLEHLQFPPEKLTLDKPLTESEMDDLNTSYTVLAKNKEDREELTAYLKKRLESSDQAATR